MEASLKAIQANPWGYAVSIAVICFLVSLLVVAIESWVAWNRALRESRENKPGGWRVIGGWRD